MYDDLIVTIMNEFLQQKLYRESELAKKLGVKEKFLGSALGKMAGHFLLQKYADPLRLALILQPSHI
jgi:hypothetical protein